MQRLPWLAGLLGMKALTRSRGRRALVVAGIAPLVLTLAACGEVRVPGVAGSTKGTGGQPATTLPSASAPQAFVDRATIVADTFRASGLPEAPAGLVLLSPWADVAFETDAQKIAWAAGKVEFESDVYILAPKDPAKGNGAVFFDVHNRGNKRVLDYFNDAPGDNRPTTEASAGDGFLFRHGYTVVWCGWNAELLPGKDRLLLRAPVATDSGKPISSRTAGIAIETFIGNLFLPSRFTAASRARAKATERPATPSASASVNRRSVRGSTGSCNGCPKPGRRRFSER